MENELHAAGEMDAMLRESNTRLLAAAVEEVGRGQAISNSPQRQRLIQNQQLNRTLVLVMASVLMPAVVQQRLVSDAVTGPSAPQQRPPPIRVLLGDKQHPRHNGPPDNRIEGARGAAKSGARRGEGVWW
eukprot:gene24302-24217_t